MDQFLSNIRNNHERIQRVLLFVFTGILIVVMLPKEGKFKYEYQKGRPWGHEDLVAPFDFAIEKPKAELDAEVALVKENCNVYLKLDAKASEKAKAGFRSKFTQAFQPDSAKQRSINKLNKNLSAGQRVLDIIYQKGILRNSSEIDRLRPGQTVYLMEGNTASQVRPDQFHTVQSAYDRMRSLLNDQNGVDRDPDFNR
jgi:hypothetical protein